MHGNKLAYQQVQKTTSALSCRTRWRCSCACLIFIGLLALGQLRAALLKYDVAQRISSPLRTKNSLVLKRKTTSAVALDTLVLYTFSNSDPEYYQNFRYFTQYGLGAMNVHNVFIIQQSASLESKDMPDLPRNAEYILHNNECYDWGSIGWALDTKKVDTSIYKYFFFMNSSVRGPFLPSYHNADVHWTALYTQRLNKDVKLVGSTINCQPVYFQSDPANEMRQNPHIQSYIVATDQVGLQVLKDEGSVFGCYKTLQDVVWYSEVGASRGILEAGYTIDALMLKYVGVDWRNKSNWNCNDRQNPYDDFAYDGVMINPLEVLFVKMKSYQLESDWITSRMAATYEAWQRNQGQHASANFNRFEKAKFSYFLSKGITMSMRGSKCFDLGFYQKSNPDMPKEDATWQHFVNNGQFEGRPFRFTCNNIFARPTPFILQEAAKTARHSIKSAIQLIEGDRLSKEKS